VLDHSTSSLGLVYGTNLVYFCNVLVELLEFLLDIQRRNSAPSVHLPSEFSQALVQTANDKSGGGNPLAMGQPQADDTEVSQHDTKAWRESPIRHR
jgi:hypothetical protein